jgi:hypothetical protein
MGVDNWGNGSPGAPAVSDINMVPSGDISVFGANKWIFEEKTCPVQSSSCDYYVMVSSTDYTPNINQSFTLTAACYGPGCSGVNYKWAPELVENGVTGTAFTTSIPTAKSVSYWMITDKPGCSTRYGGQSITTLATTTPGCNYDINLTAANYSPVVGSEVLLSANCTGPDCGVFNYVWSPMSDGVGSPSNTFNVIAGYASGNVGYQPMGVSVGKAGCPTQGRSVIVNVLPYMGTFNACVEAESSDGNGAITSDPNASNGNTRGLENNNNHYVTYRVQNVPDDGRYKVTLRYYSSSAPSVSVQLDGNLPETINLPTSGSWNIAYREESFYLNMRAGPSTIKIQGVGGGSCRQDRICVTPAPLGGRMGIPEEVIAVAEEQLNISPNPSNGDFTVDFFLAKDKDGNLIVSDTQGKVLQKRVIKGQGKHQEKVNIGNSPSGTYLIRVVREDGQEVKRALVVK